MDRWRGKLIVEGVSMIKRHTRPNPQQQIKGGIAEKESAIAISNVMVLTSGGIPTRVGYKVEPSRRVHAARPDRQEKRRGARTPRGTRISRWQKQDSGSII